MAEQMIHCKVTQNNTSKVFYLFTVYGFNQETQRDHLWANITTISHSISTAWIIMGDFNTILTKEDRFGGNEIIEQDVRELSSLLDECELHELKSVGAFFS